MDTLEVVGIKKIIWIDDDFANTSLDRNSLVREITANVEAAVDSELLNELVAVLPSERFDFSAPKEIIIDDLIRYMSEISNDELRQLAESVEGERSELSDTDVSIISDLIIGAKIELVKLSLDSWRQECRKFSTEKSGTLFLIDKEFTKEGESEDAGTEVLKELIIQYGADSPPNFVLFTHTCRNAIEEEDLRREIFAKFKSDESFDFESFNFQVLSKGVAYDKERAQSRLFNCIRAIFVRKTFAQMAHDLKSEIIQSINDVTEKLIGTNVYGLDKSIFGSSMSEGVSELELLHRIYFLSQRAAVTKMITRNDSRLVDDLTKLRMLKLQTEGMDTEHIDLAEFKRIRHEEFWSSGEDINKTCSPLVCGDIFKQRSREFILLSQPCDTILRSNGKRKSDIAVLAPIKKYNFSDETEFKSKFLECSSQMICFVFRETNIELSFWSISFNQAVAVNLDALDLCTFNENGSVQFELGQKIPKLLHLEGQRNKFNRYTEISASNHFPLNISLEAGVYSTGQVFSPLEFTKDKGWYSKLVRVRRLESVYAEHALNKYFAYKSRKAFEHDFTRH